MQKRKYGPVAVLLMVLMSLTALTTSGSAAYPYTMGESPGLPYPAHYAWVEPHSLPLVTRFFQEGHPEPPCTAQNSLEEYICLQYADLYTPEELLAQFYEDEWRKQVTGSFYSLQLISMAYGKITAIITQCAAGTQFYVTSYNYIKWEITGPVAQPEEYYPNEYVLEESTYELLYLSLTEAGIIRIERLPYHIADNITWVGFVVMQDIAGNILREQMRIYLDGEWLNPLPTEPVIAISDLQGFSWGREAIEFVVARDLMNLYLCMETHEQIAFHPSGYATRGYVLAAAVKALGLSVSYFSEAVHTPFYDVPLSGRGIYIDTAKQLGLVIGVGNNRFAPNHTITRQDMMTMLYNIMMAMGQIQPDIGLTALGRFNDFAEISRYARLPISSLARAGIIAGDGVSINPRGYVTRVEAAMFVRNLYRVGA